MARTFESENLGVKVRSVKAPPFTGCPTISKFLIYIP